MYGLKDGKNRRKRSYYPDSAASNSFTDPADRPSIYLKLFPQLMEDIINTVEKSVLPIEQEVTTAVAPTTVATTTLPTAPTNYESEDLKLRTKKPLTEQEREELREMRIYYPHTYKRLFKDRGSLFSDSVSMQPVSTSHTRSDFYPISEDGIIASVSFSSAEKKYKTPVPESETASPSTPSPPHYDYDLDTLPSTTPETPVSEYERRYPTLFDFILRGDKQGSLESVSNHNDEDKKRKIVELIDFYESYRRWLREQSEEEEETTTTTTTTDNPLRSSFNTDALTSDERSAWSYFQRHPMNDFSNPKSYELPTTTTPPASLERSLFSLYRRAFYNATPAPAVKMPSAPPATGPNYEEDDLFSRTDGDTGILESDDTFF